MPDPTTTTTPPPGRLTASAHLSRSWVRVPFAHPFGGLLFPGESRASTLSCQVLADQALEEGRHKAALRLYRASLAAGSPAPDSKTVAFAADNGGPAFARGKDKGDHSPSVAGAVAVGEGGLLINIPRDRAGDAKAAAGATAAEEAAAAAAAVGDALHGVGVALLAAGKFREACRAWERWVVCGKERRG